MGLDQPLPRDPEWVGLVPHSLACMRMRTFTSVTVESGDSPKPRVANNNMFSFFRSQRTASFRQAGRYLSKPGRYTGGVRKKNFQLEKLCGINLRSGLTPTQKCRNCCGSSLGLVDESSKCSTSKSQSRDAELVRSGKEKKKKSLSLPTVSLPAELQTALDKAMSSKSLSCIHVVSIVFMIPY